MSKTAENEQTKLRATFMNNLSIALIVGGAYLAVFGENITPLKLGLSLTAVVTGLVFH